MLWEWLSERERERFEEDGYLVIPDAVPSEQRQRLVSTIDEFTRDSLDRVHNISDIVGRHDAFFELIDCPLVFPKVASILGSNIWLVQSHYNVNPPEPPVDPKSFSYVWHRDGGCIHEDMGVFPTPRVALKVGFYFTDISEPGRGETYIVPSSHRRAAEAPPTKYSTPEDVGAVPLLIKAGSAVIYDGRVVHSVRSPNSSSVTRKAIFLQYAFRWMAPLDRMTVEHLRDRCDPIRAQLLGFSTKFHVLGDAVKSVGRSGRYYPSEEEIPLRRRMVEDLGTKGLRSSTVQEQLTYMPCK